MESNVYRWRKWKNCVVNGPGGCMYEGAQRWMTMMRERREYGEARKVEWLGIEGVAGYKLAVVEGHLNSRHIIIEAF